MKRPPSTLGDYFVSRRERGDEGLPLVSVTLRDGLVPRNTIERRFESELEDHEHLAVRKGDIAYNMMRMWQGASGLAHYDAAVSPAYVVLRPSKEIDPIFASYWFKSARMIYLFWAYSYGLTEDRLRLYYKDFAAIPAEPPPLDQQRRIGLALSECDKAIATTQALISSKRQAKNALIRRLTSEGDTRRLTEVATILFSGVDKKSVDGERPVRLCNYTDVYANSRIVAGMDFMPATATEVESRRFELRAGDVLFTKDSETADDIAASAYVPADLPGVLCGYHLAIARPMPERIRGDYLAFAMRSRAVLDQFSRAANGVVRFGLNLDAMDKIKLPVPTLAQQGAVANVLTAADREIALLTEQAKALGLQKRGLLQQMLPDEWRGEVAAAKAAAE